VRVTKAAAGLARPEVPASESGRHKERAGLKRGITPQKARKSYEKPGIGL